MKRLAVLLSALALSVGAVAEEGASPTVAELEFGGAWSLTARALGLDPRWLRFDLRDHGVQRVTLAYSELHSASLRGGRTPFRVEGTHASLPAGWVATGNTTAGMPGLGDSLRRVDAGTERQRLMLGFQRTLGPVWSVDTDLRREVRQGSRVRGLMSGITGGNSRAALVAVPVDDVTDVIDIKLTRDAGRSQFSIAWHGASYQNQFDSFSWAVPFAAHPAWAPGAGHPDAIGRMALEPSNRFHQLTVAGALRVGQGARITGDVAYGRMRQDELFLPYSENPALVTTAPLPRPSLDGRVDSLVGNLRVTLQPNPRTQIAASVRYDTLENRTAQDEWPYVAADSQFQRAELAARINLPYGHREQRAELAVSHRLPGRTRLTAGWRHQDIRREFAESRGATENTIRVGLRSSVETVAFSLDYRSSSRNAREYDGRVPYVAGRVPGTVGNSAFENHPLLRRYNLTDRDREQFAVRMDWSGSSGLSLGANAQRAEDRYDDAFFGLNRGRVRQVGIDAGYQLGDRTQVSAWIARDAFLTGQRGRSFTAAPGTATDPDRDWSFEGRDRVDSHGLSFNTAIGERATIVGVDLVRSHARSRFDTVVGPALTSAPLPEVRSRVDGYSLHATVPFGIGRSLRLALEHERLRGTDFATDGVLPDTLANVLTLGEGTPRYSMTWVTARFRHRF